MNHTLILKRRSKQKFKSRKDMDGFRSEKIFMRREEKREKKGCDPKEEREKDES